MKDLANNVLTRPSKWTHLLDEKKSNPQVYGKWPDLKDHKGRALWLNNYGITKEVRGAILNLIGAKVIKPIEFNVCYDKE